VILGNATITTLPRATLEAHSGQMDIRTGYAAIGTDSQNVASPQRSPPCSGCTGSPAAINYEFRKSTEGLAHKDHHFIHQGQDDVMSMSVVDKRGWLQGIQLARESHLTAPPARQ
jgi:hypothetical protein